jgi:hypothetical protein
LSREPACSVSSQKAWSPWSRSMMFSLFFQKAQITASITSAMAMVRMTRSPGELPRTEKKKPMPPSFDCTLD